MYFIVGYESVRMLTREELISEFEEELREIEDGEAETKYLDSMPEDSDPAYWDDAVLIIKGEIVVPKPRQVVMRYEIE